MGIAYNTSIVTDGLVLCLDAANKKSYPGTGTTWSDLSGNGNNGTIVNATFTSDLSTNTFNFTSGTTYIDIPNNLQYVTQFSAGGWFKSLGTPGSGYHILLGGDSLEISMPTSGEIRTGVTTSNGRFVSNHGLGIVDGKWHFLSMTFDGTSKRSFIDGVFVGAQAVTGTLQNIFANRRIGVYGSQTIYFTNGYISNVFVYNRSLSDTEIQQNFNALRGRYGV